MPGSSSACSPQLMRTIKVAPCSSTSSPVLSSDVMMCLSVVALARPIHGGRQLGIRLYRRMMRSKLRAGATRYTALMVRAVLPAVRRSLGFRSVAAATITWATTPGSSPLLRFSSISSS